MICAPPQPPLPPKIKKWHIAYLCSCTLLSNCAKFHLDWSSSFSSYSGQTDRHTFIFMVPRQKRPAKSAPTKAPRQKRLRQKRPRQLRPRHLRP